MRTVIESQQIDQKSDGQDAIAKQRAVYEFAFIEEYR
jgi:hypothetical protein